LSSRSCPRELCSVFRPQRTNAARTAIIGTTTDLMISRTSLPASPATRAATSKATARRISSMSIPTRNAGTCASPFDRYEAGEIEGSPPMSPRMAAALVLAASMGFDVQELQAGPCSHEIAQFEQMVRQSRGNPDAGPYARQSIGAQLDRQPTPGSIKRAEQQAQASFNVTLARAKRLDARNDRAGCTKALSDAKAMYDL